MRAREYLNQLEFHGIKLGLENITTLLEGAGNPHREFPSVHVAGTNGKGSVIAFLDAMLRASGYRTGRFTSPHILSFNERITISGVPLPDNEIDDHIEVFRAIAEARGITPTYFELNTAIAFRAFDLRRVDISLVEVGMGGRFDSTNVIEPMATAITNIDLEHMKYLGDTIEKIAFEKAGIVKRETPLVLGERRENARKVILDRAAECGARVLDLGQDFSYALEGDDVFDLRFSYTSPRISVGPVTLNLAGKHQGENAAMAVCLAEILRQDYIRVSPVTIARGLERAKWPCRLEKVLDDPPVSLDVAHNVAGAARLAGAVRDAVMVVAIASDKDAAGMIDALRPAAHRIIVTQFQGTRAYPVADFSARISGIAHETAPTLEDAIARGMEMASAAHPLVITGSIFTAAKARRVLMERYGLAGLEF